MTQIINVMDFTSRTVWLQLQPDLQSADARLDDKVPFMFCLRNILAAVMHFFGKNLWGSFVCFSVSSQASLFGWFSARSWKRESRNFETLVGFRGPAAVPLVLYQGETTSNSECIVGWSGFWLAFTSLLSRCRARANFLAAIFGYLAMWSKCRKRHL